MAELGGMLAAAILKVVGDQIGSVIGGQITLQKNFDKNLKKMKMALESIDAVLEDAQKRSITDKSTLLWLKRLKDVLYAISDMIDEFEADTQAITQPSAQKLSFKKYLSIMIPCLIIGPKIIMANKMEEIMDELDVIADQHNKFKLAKDANANEPKVADIRETTSIMETQIIGRTTEKEDILASLSDSMHEDITILPICGIGGLGKTTLAKMVYNSSQFKEYSQVWVYVSQTFDLKNIGYSIISQLSEEVKQSEYTSMQMIQNSLQKLLANKKILIVLDDLWEGDIFHLKSLMDMLKIGKGSNVVVIVTTRDEDIAKNISTIQPYKLAPLTDDICWSIIKQKSEFESKYGKEQLEEIGKVIAMKCCGVALAAISLGYLLQSMEASEWESVRDSNIWNVSSSVDTTTSQVLASLKLSYSIMPSYLKLCFAYCAIFPKGHNIVKEDLIQQWVSLGFSTRQLGELCVNQLLGLSFLEHSKSPSTIKLHVEDTTLLTMHDLVHDLSRSVMGDEIIVVGEGDDAKGCRYHYALCDDCSKPLGSELSKIRALRFTKCHNIKFHDAAFSCAKSLRVLDLTECSIHKLPESTCLLQQLRYLNAPRVQHATIPDSIAKLSKLTYLDLHGAPTLVTLPESIGEIEGLAYLDLSGCSGIHKLPASFERLKKLVHLNLSNCSCIGGVSEFLGSLTHLQYLNLSYCPNIGELPEDLGGLSKLQYLNLSFSSYLECCQEAEVLGALNKLKYLNLSSEHCHLKKLPEALGRFIQLKYLNLSGCELMKELPTLFGSLKCLEHLDLSNCCRVDHIEDALVGLTNLQYLNLKNTSIGPVPEGLTKLRYLILSGVRRFSTQDLEILLSSDRSNLEYLDLSHTDIFTVDGICSLTKLHTLDLSWCRCLRLIPDNIGTIDSLKFLYLIGCSGISGEPQLNSTVVLILPHFKVQSGNGDSRSNLVQLQHIDPVELKITELENVKSDAEAHHINLMGKHKLEDLKLEWSREAKRFVDEKMLLKKLVPPSTLKKLEICGYNSVSLPAWLVRQLPNLETLIFREMYSLEEWNTSYSSGEEHVIEILEIHDCPLLRMKPLPPRAKYWEISNSDNVLSSWEECAGPHTNVTSSFSPVTTMLLVENCKIPLHQWRLLQHFPRLTILHIKCAVDLTGSPEVIRHLSSLEILTLEYQDFEELPKWLNESKRLKSLAVWDCNSMASLPHWLGELVSLTELLMWGCAVLSSLPESMPSSLSSLQICRCNGIKSLPEGMEQLTNLYISDCPDLKQWCELKENKMKLAHIKKKEIW